MKKGLIQKGLYLEGLRQTRVIGILSIIITEVISLLNLASFIISGVDLYDNHISTDYASINPVIIFFTIICSFIMPLFLFGFLNKRNQSDYYHSLPYKRETIACSFLASIFTWIIANILITTLLSYCFYAILLAKYCAFNFASILLAVLSTATMSVMIVGATILAMSITGTGLNNVLVTLMILFIPRIFISAAYSIIKMSPIADIDHLSFPFGRYNILYNGLQLDAQTVLYTPANTIYSLLLGLLYLVIGVLLFKKRKSETAGLSAPSSFLQACFRVILSTTFSLFATIEVTKWFIDNENIDSFNIIWVITLYTISVFIFFIYEISTTRSTKTLVRIIPSLGIVILLNFVFGFSSTCVYNSIQNNIPEPEDIKYVSVIYDDQSMTSAFLNGDSIFKDYQSGYFSMKLSSVKIQDEEINKIVSTVLKSNVSSSTYEDYYNQIVIQIKLNNGKKMYRRLYFTSNLPAETYDSFDNIIKNNSEYQKIFFDLPDPSKTNTIVSLPDQFYIDFPSSNNDEVIKIYDCLLDEISSYNRQKWINYFCLGLSDNTSNDWYSNDIVGNINVYTYVGATQVSLSLPVTTQYPKTCQMYLDLLTKYNTTKWIELIKQDPSSLSDRFYLNDIYINAYNFNEKYINSPYTDANVISEDKVTTYTDDYIHVRESFVDYLSKNGTEKVDITKPFYIFKFRFDRNKSNEAYTRSNVTTVNILLQANDDTIKIVDDYREAYAKNEEDNASMSSSWPDSYLETKGME